MVDTDGGKILGKGSITFYFNRLTSKGNEHGGAKRVEVGRRLPRKTMRKMMEKKSPTRLISKTIVKKIKGAKSRSKKGKLLGDLKTDSSQMGIKKFLSKARGIIGIKEISHGELKSHGNSKNST